jgi:segregation and condensation protein B
MINLLGAIEALIFACAEPLSIAKIKEILELAGYEATDIEINQAFDKLLGYWSNSQRNHAIGFELTQVAGGLAFRTHADYGPLVSILFKNKPQKLSNSVTETLAIIAYRQPITRIEIEEIRGVESSTALRKLINLKLIKIIGKQEVLGKPLLYGTTKQFLEFFGLNSLNDLPKLSDLPKDSEPIIETSEEAQMLNDLFEQRPEQMFSDNVSKMSDKALKDLEKALNNANEVAKTIEEKL